MIKRLVVAAILSALSAFSFAATPKLIAYLGSDSLSEIQARTAEISQHLGRLGHKDGGDYSIAARSYFISGATVATRREVMVKQVDEIVLLNPAIIYAGNVDVLSEVKKRTTTIPVIFSVRSNLKSIVIDHVQNPAAPEGNLTGITRYINLVEKKIQYVKDAFPLTKSIGFVYANDILPERKTAYEKAAASFGLTFNLRRISDVDVAGLAAKIDSMPDDAFITAQDDLMTIRKSEVITQLARVRRPLIHCEPGAASEGVLMHYVATIDREAKIADYISKLLNGVRVRDLPVQEPQDFDFSINLATMRRNGHSIPAAVLNRARLIN
jgi:putative tryptophan/tyrosine transport system substrate-binding protein